ncbi:MAG: hypothetical protein ABI432_13060 [Flavobacteriales bacterium]
MSALRSLPSTAPTTRIWSAILTVAMIAFLYAFYAPVFKWPNSMLFSGEGDGLKNYFTYVWHVDHDAAPLHFGGSNYPYGDHVFFTDGHPLLSWVLRSLPFLAPFKIAIVNMSLVFGLVLCAWCLFAILHRSGVPPWAAALGAFGLTVLEPQIFRMSGHLALAHCWIFPLTWYLLLRTRDGTRRWLWAGLSGASVLVAFLIHPYLGMMNAMFVVGYYAWLLFSRWRANWKQWTTYAEPLLIAVLPMVLFMLLLTSSDAALDRPDKPYMAAAYVTHPFSLLVATHPPLSVVFFKFFRYEKLDWETWCYLGSASVLMLVIVAGVQVKRWAVRSDERGAHDDLDISLGAAFLVLLFAMNMWQDLFGKWFPMLAQFRATGRFAWAFYYVCGVFSTVRAYQYLYLRGTARRAIAAVVFITLIGLYTVEGWDQHLRMSAAIVNTPNLFEPHTGEEDFAALVSATIASEANAIIPLPYVHVGSDRYQKDGTEKLLALAYPLAFRTNTPLMAGATIRTSLQRTRALMALLTPLTFPKTVAQDVPADARFLLLWSKEALEPEEERLWQRGTPVFENGIAALRIISASDLFACDQEARSKQFEMQRTSMVKRDGWLFSLSDTTVSRILLDRAWSPGEAAGRASSLPEYNTLFELAPGSLDSALTYEASFIYHAVGTDALNISLILENSLGDGSDTQWEVVRNLRTLPMQFEDRTIATVTFKPAHPDRRYKLYLHGYNELKDPYEVDHLLLRPLGVDAWREGQWNGMPSVFFNNIPLSPAAYAAPAPTVK